MVETNYLDQAQAFLNRNGSRFALRAIPVALMVVAAAHADPSFSAPNSTNINNGCSGGAVSGSLAGSPTNGGLGLTLSGSATQAIANNNCGVTLQWKGNGSGSFVGATENIASTFTITPPSDGSVRSWTLTVLVNGTQQAQFSCTALVTAPNIHVAPRPTLGNTSCTGTQTVPSSAFNVPASLSNWEVDLAVNFFYGPSGNAATVSVPSAASIDLLAAGSAAAPVPALTPVSLAATSVLLLALAVYAMFGRKQSGDRFRP